MPRRRRRAPALGQAVLAAQTSAFTECFGFDGFYAEACLALFLPGLLIQFLQNRLDHKFDRLTSSSGLVESTAKLNIGRVIVGHLMQLAALLAFLIVLQSDLPHGGASAQRSDHVRYVMLGMFVLIGFGSGNTQRHFLDSSRCPSRSSEPHRQSTCAAVVYGTKAQAVAMFPEKFHAFFFIGTYSVSLLIAPVNAAIGDLCTAPAHGDVYSPHCAQPHHSHHSHCAGGALRSGLPCRS